MFTLHVTDTQYTSNVEAPLLSIDLQKAGAGDAARAPLDWPRERLKCVRSCSLAILADAAKPVLDWCWS